MQEYTCIAKWDKEEKKWDKHLFIHRGKYSQ